jgi:hypothetical protein
MDGADVGEVDTVDCDWPESGKFVGEVFTPPSLTSVGFEDISMDIDLDNSASSQAGFCSKFRPLMKSCFTSGAFDVTFLRKTRF